MEKIEFIAVVGTLLRQLVKSQVIKKCLYSIIGLLPDRVVGIQAKVDKKMDKNNDDNDQQDRDGKEDEDELEGDHESDSVGQGSASIKLEPKSQACLRSLNLAVVFINAILVVSHFVKTQNLSSVSVTINIKIFTTAMPKQRPVNASLEDVTTT